RDELERDEALTDAEEAEAATSGPRSRRNGGVSNGGVSNGDGIGGPFKERVAALERQLIKEALERAGGNRTKAAEDLGIYRRLLYAKIREYGLGE
ncbi:MAG TPA: helix-turn-helix domain-containing protein, partial [Candidatus Limnocylindria bacterium]